MNDPNRMTKWLLVIGLVAVSLLVLYPPDEKLKGGIDLVGGSSLLFEMDTTDLDAADQQDLAGRVMRVLKERVDPQGQMNLEWRPVGNTRLEIRMPLPPKKARDRREAYDGAIARLAESNVRRREIEEALHSPGDQRASALQALARGVDSRGPLLDSLAKAYAAYETARLGSDAATTKTTRDAYESAVSALMSTNFPVGRFTDLLSAKKGRREAEIAKLQAEFPAFDAGSESDANGKRITKAIAAYDAWSRFKADLEDPSDLKRRLRGAGVLEFRILANRDPSSPSSTTDNNPQYRQPISRYVEQLAQFGPRPRGGDVFQWFSVENIVSFADAADMDKWKATKDSPGRPIIEEYAGKWYVLAYLDPDHTMLHGMGGGRKWKLERSLSYRDPLSGQNVVNFRLDPRGGDLFGDLTERNVNRWLAIFLDNNAVSYANILERIGSDCQIKGDFSPERANDLVRKLEAGSLPARLKETPLSETTIGPSLGQSNRERGMKAAMWGGIATLAFVFFYYRIAGGGVVNIALVMNLVLLLAAMSLLQATFTLPGIAGLILSIAMAVDANVLIFERYREERDRGVPFRKAILAGYDKAFSTILDSNLTTIITCIILVMVGSEEIKGFGTVLGLGIAISMFTSLFVTKLIFNTLMANGLLNKISMITLMKTPSVDWLGLRTVFLPGSAAVVVLGVAGFFWMAERDPQTVFDIEFLGGTSVQLDIKPTVTMTDEELREAISSESWKGGTSAVAWLNKAAGALPTAQVGIGTRSGQLTATSTELSGEQLATLLAPAVEGAVEKDGIRHDGRTVTLDVKPGKLTQETLKTALADAARIAADAANRLRGARIQNVGVGSGADKQVSYEVVTTETNRPVIQAAILAAVGDKLAIQRALRFDLTKDADDDFFVVEESDHYLKDVIETDAAFDIRPFRGGLALDVQLAADEQPISVGEIDRRIRQVGLLPEFEQLRSREFSVIPLGQARAVEGEQRYMRFAILALDEVMVYSEEHRSQWVDQVAHTQAALVRAALGSERSLTKVVQFAPQIAGQSRSRAVFALMLSLIAVAAYLWIRFGTMDYGVAAIIALAHDVGVTLTFICLAHLLWNTLIGRVLDLQPFKLDSAMIAAVLTIIGYSLNDTIVVFDRIRENRGRSQALSANLINASINQTLSRTLLTSVTTLLVLLILFVIGGDGVHGFSYALFIGVVVGTYSSFGVAASLLYQPRLMWTVTVLLIALGFVGAVFVTFEESMVRLVLSGIGVAFCAYLLSKALKSAPRLAAGTPA